MENPGFSGIGHLDLSVSDVDASAGWYERVLGLRRLRRVEFSNRTMIVLLDERSRLIIGLNQHEEIPDGRFDERRVGLDHVGFSVNEREDLDVWETHLKALGVEHSPVTDTEGDRHWCSVTLTISSLRCGGPSHANRRRTPRTRDRNQVKAA